MAITREQAERANKQVRQMVLYLIKMQNRLHAHGFDHTHALFADVYEARERLASVSSHFHYLSCEGGVGDIYRGNKNPR